MISVRSVGRGWQLVEGTLESSQRRSGSWSCSCSGSPRSPASLGLDILLGGFAAGIITRLAVRGREVEVLESKLTAVGFGFLIPSSSSPAVVDFDLDSLLSSAGALLKVPLFLALFLIVRGAPALLLYRGVFAARERVALAFFLATELPLVVAITTIAVEQGHMRSSTAAALVGAAILSTLIYPFVGLALRRGASERNSANGSPAPATP